MLRSMRPTDVEAYYRKYGEAALANEVKRRGLTLTHRAGLHRARLTLPSFSDEEKRVSREWLRDNGFEQRGL